MGGLGGSCMQASSSVFDNRAMRLLVMLGVLASVPALSADSVSVERHADHIEVSFGGQPFTTFYFGPEATKPYLHPLRAADGTIVTRRYPMEQIEGEQTDHAHHRGAWFSHGEVNGFDFWANETTQNPRDKKGAIVLDSIAAAEAGRDVGRIEASFAWKAPSGERLLTEHRTMWFRRLNGDNIVDFEIGLIAAVESVHLGDTKEGTFGVRVATELEEPHLRPHGIPRTGRIRNAEGLTTEAQTWGKRSAWVDYAGSIGGKPLGIAIFDHPANPKHPTYWHVRGYGLFAANIFGEHHFHADQSRDGSLTLAHGESLRFRYRIVIHPGRTPDADLAHKYEAWASSRGLPTGQAASTER